MRVAFALLLAGCFAPTFQNGDTPCATNAQCPPEFHCASNSTCWTNGEEPTDSDLSVAAGSDLSVTTVDLSVAASDDLNVSATDLASNTDLVAPVDLETDIRYPDLGVGCSNPGTLTGTMISDFESGDANVQVSASGFWYPATDGTGTLTPTGTVSSNVLESARGSSLSGLHTTGTGFTDYGGGVGLNFYPDGLQALPADASAYTGITFWAKGTSSTGKVTVSISTTGTRSNCGPCTTCFDDFRADITLAADWTQYSLAWNDFDQAGWGVPQVSFDATQIEYINFNATTSWDYWLDDLSFTQ